MSKSHSMDHLCELFELIRENRLNDEQFTQLDAILRESERARKAYVNYVKICSELKNFQRSVTPQFDLMSNEAASNIAEEDINQDYSNAFGQILDADRKQIENAALEKEALAKLQEQEKTLLEARQRRIRYAEMKRKLAASKKTSRLAVFGALTSIAAMLILALNMWLSPPRPPLIPVAMLVDTVNAQWGGEHASINKGEQLRPGSMVLLKGYAKIEFDAGADVIVHAPARFELQSDNQIFLRRGRVSSLVRPEAKGFTICTPTATVVDYGTEFGVVVDDFGRTETHVFKGQVELRAGPDSRVFEQAQRLRAGQAGIVDEDSKLVVSDLEARPEDFITGRLDPYEIAIQMSKPLAHWKFGEPDNSVYGRFLSEKNKNCDFIGDVELVRTDTPGGPTTDAAVRLDGNGSYVNVFKVGRKKEARPYTYIFWIKPQAIRAQDILVTTNAAAEQYRHLVMTEKGTISRFTRFMSSKANGVSIEGSESLRPGRWYQIAVTGESGGKMLIELHIYINGREVASGNAGGTYLPEYMANFMIGSVPDRGKAPGYESFKGDVTGVVEYDRVLSGAEIQKIYNSAMQ